MAGAVSAGELREFLRERVAKWWIPRTAVGKYDKVALRRRYRA